MVSYKSTYVKYEQKIMTFVINMFLKPSSAYSVPAQTNHKGENLGSS